MVVRGDIRGNGSQLAQYLTTQRDNDSIRILEVDGRDNATSGQLSHTLLGMSLMAELTKSAKGLYHAQINPAYTEDKAMTDSDWHKAADILAHELGFDRQRRVIVLHEKKGRIHAHVVWERYDYDTGKMIDVPFNYHAHDKARQEMERLFAQEPTPKPNRHRPELKEQMTALWERTETAEEFITEAEKAGYMIAAGIARRPFMVVDASGRSFDLVRQLKGVRTKDVQRRLCGTILISDKKAIDMMRQRKQHIQEKVKEFAVNRMMTAGEKKIKNHAKQLLLIQDFAGNRNAVTERETRKQALIRQMTEELERARARNKDRSRGRLY